MAAKEKENNHNIQTVSVGEAKQVILNLLNTMSPEECPSIVVIGPVGCGKTESIMQAMREARKPLNPIVRHLAQVHPLDMGGVGLDMEKRELYYAKSPLYTEVMETEGPRGLFLDEIDRTQPIAQSSFLQTLSEKKSCGRVLEDTYVLAAANAWHAQYTFEMDKAMASRLAMLHVQPNTQDWLKWASGAGVHGAVVTTIVLNPDVLNEQGEAREGALKVADPRAWASLSKALHKGFDLDYSAMFVGEYAARKIKDSGKVLSKYEKEIKMVSQGKQVELEDEQALFVVYLAAAGLVREVPKARAYMKNCMKQLGNEKSYIVCRLVTYSLPGGMEAVRGDEELHKCHMEMVGSVLE